MSQLRWTFAAGRLYDAPVRKARLISAFLALFATAAQAGPVEDGFAAYARGDFARAVTLWRPYAENGDARAQNFMGDLYFAGQGVAQDFRQALFWFKLAAGKGSAAARYNLGVAAEQGRGMPASRTQAMSWYKQAAEKGNVPAMRALARLALASDPPDEEGAAHWTQKAADTGDPQAEDELGTLYRLGKGVEPDLARVALLARAREWYRKAGEQGYAPAQNNLGMMYRLGAGGPPDYERAFGWLHRAADNGVATASFNIGAMYALGLGSAKDPVEAYVWYSRALAASDAALHGQAQQSLALLKSQMKPAEIAEAERRLAR
jgi:TPR repeat protein